jgi:hypothetical protein
VRPQHPDDIFNALSAEFHPDDVKVRDGGQGRKLPYIRPRTAANRLDEVLGWQNWECDVVPVSDHAYKCVLTVTLPDGRRVTKAAIGAKSTMSKSGKVDPGDDDKGGDSDAFKRAASLFGVGRYLYNDGVYHAPDTRDDGLPEKVDARTKGEKLADWARKKGIYAKADALSRSNYGAAVEDLGDEAATKLYDLLRSVKPLAEVPPPKAKEPPPPAQPRGAVNENGNRVDFGWPRTGAALYAWTRNLEDAFKVSLVRAVDAEFCVPGGWGREWKSWTPEQAQQAAVSVARRVKALPGYDGQFDAHVPDSGTIKEHIVAAAVKLLRATGTPEPGKEDIDRCILAVATDLERGWDGETLGDFYACEDLPRLQQLQEQVEKDLADSGIPF